tara:strand:+ start:54 stop:449 length:396 start_codon:yes stop_codon:yes gene_type:complete
MLDVTSPKVATPVMLFALLSPGMILQLPPSELPKSLANVKKALFTGETGPKSVIFHALVFLVLYRIIAKQMGLVLTQTDLAVTTALFVALSPGMLLTLPGGSGTSPIAVLVHALVFAVVFALLRKQFPLYY